MLEGYCWILHVARISQDQEKNEFHKGQIVIVYFVWKVQEVAHHFFLLQKLQQHELP